MSDCLSLISCDGQCNDVHNIIGSSRSNLLPYVNQLVRINNNIDCTFFVRNPVFVGFTIDTPDFLCNLTSTDNLSSYGSVTYKVNSVSYDGVELITSPIKPEYIIVNSDFDCLICDTDSAICVDATNQVPNNSNAHSEKLNQIFSSLGFNIQVFPYGQSGGVVFRIYDIDRFGIEIERTTAPNAGVYKMVYNSNGFFLTFNGVSINSGIVVDNVNTCTSNKSNFLVSTVTGVTECGIANTFDDYITVNECDVITIHPMDVSCNIVNTFSKTGSTRSATLVVTGGTPPYSFLWENGNTTPTITNLPAGTYNAIVSDAFGDYVIETSCFLPPIDCTRIKILPNLSYRCDVTGGNIQTGTAVLSIVPTGGVGPYTITGDINGSPATITNNMVVNHLDFITILVTDSNGCESEVTSIGIICVPGTPPPDPFSTIDTTEPCLGLIKCPGNPNTFLLEISATTSDLNLGNTPPSYAYELNFKLSSPSNYSGTVVGSYKIFEVDLPNSFLNQLTPNNITNDMYWLRAYGTPKVALNDYVEFGFTELTPLNPNNSNSPWNHRYYPYNEKNPAYTPTYSWIPGTSSIQIAVALFDNEYCVHKGTTTIIIPTTNTTNNTSILF